MRRPRSGTREGARGTYRRGGRADPARRRRARRRRRGGGRRWSWAATRGRPTRGGSREAPRRGAARGTPRSTRTRNPPRRQEPRRAIPTRRPSRGRLRARPRTATNRGPARERTFPRMRRTSGSAREGERTAGRGNGSAREGEDACAPRSAREACRRSVQVSLATGGPARGRECRRADAPHFKRQPGCAHRIAEGESCWSNFSRWCETTARPDPATAGVSLLRSTLAISSRPNR